MYELNRVFLQSIGPKGARYEDVLLDFRDRDGDPARGSVLYLENGGGKSVLLKLMFSALLPGRKYVLGADANSKTLENFVLTGDTGHVVLEWRRVSAQGQALPELLLTGKVYEWRSRQHSADSKNLREAWYTLRPADGALTLDSLPARAERDGSNFKRPFNSYKEQLDAANAAHPELDLVWTDVQRRWLEHLDALGLDPELFKYQRQMNVDEGDADEVFAFSTHEAFIDFLLKAVTDIEGPTELATNVDAYSDKLRDRERLQLEGRFVDGALERLRPLAAAARRRDDADRGLQAAQHEAETVHAQFDCAAKAALAEKAELGERAEEQEKRSSRLETRSRELQEQLRELRRRAAQFRLDAAEAAFLKAESQRLRAQDELAAWRAAEPLASHRAASARVKALDALLAAAEREAAPLLKRQAGAARRYAGALLALIDEARAQSADCERAAAVSRDAAGAQVRAGDAALTAAGRLRAEAKAAQARVDAIEAERERLVAAKLLGRGQSAEDALNALNERQADAQRSESQANERLKEIDGRLHALAQEAAGASAAETRASEHANRLEQEREVLSQRAHELAGSERLRELAAVERVELWRMADPLRQALTEAAAKTERDIVLLELKAADDRHAKRALEQTGRLPADRDATTAAEVLRAASIPAVTGWDFLAESVRASDRELMLRRLPELVGGVIITNPAHRERAEAVLAEAAIRPTSVIALGESAELAAADARGRERFVVEPNAALYDEVAGEDELQARSMRLTQVSDRRRELDERYRHDQDLRHTFEQLLADCPAGRLAELAGAAAQQQAVAAQAAQTADAARNESAALTQERPQRDTTSRQARDDLQVIAAQRPRLEGFRERSAEERELRDSARRRGEEAEASDEKAAGHARAAQERRDAAQESTRAGDDHARRSDRLNDELQTVQGAGAEVKREKADTPIEELRDAYAMATRLLDTATTGSELSAEHRHAQSAEADVRSRLEEFGPDQLSQAAELLDRATDRASRREGELRAGRNAKSAEERRAERLAERGQREQELQRETPKDESGRGPRAQLTDELIPRDLDHALALQQRLDVDRIKAQEEQRTAAEAARQARERASKADSRAQVIGSYAESVVSALASTGVQLSSSTSPDAAPFAGNPDEARELMRETVSVLQRADDTLDGAEDEVRSCAEQVKGFAQGDEFEAMAGGNLRQTLSRDDSVALARRSSGLIPHLESRAAEVAKELASIEQHRVALLQRLASLVQAGLAVLRQAGRASRLPADLGDWSGKPFLRIDFDTPDSEDVLLERLGDVLDSSVTQTGSRDGMTMLLRGVRAAADPKGFRVTVLKPDTVLRDERVQVTAMREFSGGQRLTAAIALYCTLAAMRSSSRGRQKARAGVLFLDNPIGKASAEYLLDIQLKVADRVGVQLVYTTGVYDLNALSKFPCVVRLRNDLDMRAGMQRIRVADGLRAALLKGRSGEDDRGYLDVARVVHDRSEEPAPA